MPIALVHVKLDRLPFVGEINCNTWNSQQHKLRWNLYLCKGSKDPEDPANNIPPPFGVKTQMSISHQALVARALAALVDHGRRGRPEARFAAITKWCRDLIWINGNHTMTCSHKSIPKCLDFVCLTHEVMTNASWKIRDMMVKPIKASTYTSSFSCPSRWASSQAQGSPMFAKPIPYSMLIRSRILPYSPVWLNKCL